VAIFYYVSSPRHLSPTTSLSSTPYARIQTTPICYPSTSPSGTPTDNVSTAAALNTTYVTGRVHHFLTILSVGTHASILYHLSSPGLLAFNPRLPQAILRLGYNPRHIVLLPSLPRYSLGQSYNGCSHKLYSMHWRCSAIFLYHSARLALMRPPSNYLNGAILFPTRLPHALPRIGYNTRHLVIQQCFSQALPRLRLQQPQP